MIFLSNINLYLKKSGHRTFTIKKLGKYCECKIQCQLCIACIHKFSCTCAIYLDKNAVCPHIHATQIYLVTKVNFKYFLILKKIN